MNLPIKVHYYDIILEKFYAKKHTDVLCPSEVDLMLMVLSKELTMPLISNDYDITFFRDDLYKKNLVGEIISFNSLQYV